MIDKFNEIFTRIKERVISEYPNLSEDNFSSEQINVPSTMPHIAVIEADSPIEIRRMDSSGREKFTRVLIQVNVYSTKVYRRVMEARAISNIIDDEMYRMNFTRESRVPLNLDSSTNYRIISRYEAVLDEGGFYRT